MLISHEVPLQLLEQSKSFNDYDYCLLHLTYKYPEYKQYYINGIREGRRVVLDNSIFELSEPLTVDQVAEGVIDINPTWYIIPDCLDNSDTTISRFQEFKLKYGKMPGTCIGVVQGDTLKNLTDCYKYMSEFADKIAIPFDSRAFDELVPGETNNLKKWCDGRERFVEYLVDSGVWNNNKPHHLLGCSLAREFSYPLYKTISIESVDTSNPIVAAIQGLRYDEDGLDEKPITKLCDLIDYVLTPEQLNLVDINTRIFRNICNSYQLVK